MTQGPVDFQEQVLPKLLDAAFGKPDDGWMKYQWAQFSAALVVGVSLSAFGGVLLARPPSAVNSEVLTPVSTGFIGTGVGICTGACGIAAGGGAKPKAKKNGGK